MSVGKPGGGVLEPLKPELRAGWTDTQAQLLQPHPLSLFPSAFATDAALKQWFSPKGDSGNIWGHLWLS